MEVPTMVIKVKYQETLRRFNVRLIDDEIDLNMDRLWEKLHTFFNLTPNTEVLLTYIDEDGDEVALLDDDDLRDAAMQGLDPLRITVKLNSRKNGIRYCPRGTSTPLKSPCVQQPVQNCLKILRTVPEPLIETVVKLSSELANKASSSASGVTEVLSYLAHCSDSQHATQTMTQSDVTKSIAAAKETKNLEPSKVDVKVDEDRLKVPSNGESDRRSLGHNESSENENERLFNSSNDEKLGIALGVIMKAPALTEPCINDVALELKSISVGQPVITESKVVPDKISRHEHIEKIGECLAKDKPIVTPSNLPPVSNREGFIGKLGSASNFPTENATNIRGPNLERYPFNFSASNPIKVDHIGGRTKSLILGNCGNSTGSIWAHNPSFLKFPDMGSSHSRTDDCPISRVPVQNGTAFESNHASTAVKSSGCKSQNVVNFHVFHCGIFCDGCGVHPITGPRFKSKVKDYDLCMICFAEMGNAIDFIRIDLPVVYPHHVLCDSHAKDPVSSQDCRVLKVKSCLSKMDSCFIKDVNIADDTVMSPLTPFTKIWRLKNNGIVAWPKKTIIFWMGGDELSDEVSIELKIPATGLAINQEVDVAVDCIAPGLPGKYESCWGLAASPSGQRFGQLIWIRIKVVASVAAKPLENIRSFNLNLPPLRSLNDPEITDVVPESIVGYCQNNPDNNSNRSVESSSVPSTTAPVSHPYFDLSNMTPAFPSMRSEVIHPFIQLPDINLPASEDEEMSFKSAGFNEDASTVSEDNLDLDDVSEFSEWDPILDVLLDMGFHDMEMNKKLLEKNNGSIKHVVMELIAAEINE